MIFKASIASLFLISSISSHAAVGTAKVELLEGMGIASVNFTGAVAKAMYQDLRSGAFPVTQGLREKTGQNISCTEEIQASSRGAVRKYTCAMLIMSDTGAAYPSSTATPASGHSIRN